jgi:PAS domain-containing protein
MRSQQPVEMILLRQVASYLAVPVWMMDEHGNLIYYNEPAEELLGIQFDDAGPVHADQVGERFKVSDFDGEPLADNEVPVVVALTKGVPDHRDLRFQGSNGVWRDVSVTALPVEGQGGRFLGVFATFWELRA